MFIRHRPSFIQVPNYGNSEIGETVEEIPNKKKKGKEVASTCCGGKTKEEKRNGGSMDQRRT